MKDVCDVCNKELKGKANDAFGCNFCTNRYHINCLSLTREEQRRLRTNPHSYRCPSCKGKTKESISDSTPSRNVEGTHSSHVPIETLMQMQAAFELMKKEMTDFTKSLTYTAEEMSHFRQDFIEVKNQLKELDHYKSEVTNLRLEVAELRKELADRGQQRYLKDIEINGLTENSSENLQQIVKTMSVKLGVELDERDVDEVRRVGVRGEGAGGLARPRPVIVSFTRRSPRDKLLRAARVRRGFTTDMVEVPGASRRVYINEHLTKEKRVLFSKARSTGRDLKFKYVWTNNGNIFMRRSDTSSVVRVLSEAILQKLNVPKGPDQHNQGTQPFQDSI